MTSLLPDNLLDELNDLTFACLSGEAGPEDIEHLNKLLLNSEPARRVYAHTIRDSFILRQWAAATELHTREMLGDDDSDAAFLRLAIADADLIATASSSNSRVDDPHTAAPIAAVPVPGFFSTAYHGTIGFFSQELPFSLLIATVLTSLGLWAASMVYVSGPDEIARDSSSLPSKATFDPTLKVVGKITGMVDCKWADPKTETFNGANVLLGRKYALASGLMEITYDTGAKVILQGPVTYEIDSATGGYLSDGKLTARLQKDLVSYPQSRVSKPLFVVRTRTASVTDLGTEFGVRVSDQDLTQVYVFAGVVLVEDGKRNVSRLKAQESIQVTTSGFQSAEPNSIAKHFVRVLPASTMTDGSFSDHLSGMASSHWINPQVADYTKYYAAFTGHDNSDRVYLLTTARHNYGMCDFVATVKITNAFGASGSAFFGLGDGQSSDYFSEPGKNPPFAYLAYWGEGWCAEGATVRCSADRRTPHVLPSFRSQAAETTITAKIVWMPATTTAVFSVDVNNDGRYDTSVTVSCPDFASSESCGRLFIGGTNGVRFSDFRVDVASPRRSDGNSKPSDGGITVPVRGNRDAHMSDRTR